MSWCVPAAVALVVSFGVSSAGAQSSLGPAPANLEAAIRALQERLPAEVLQQMRAGSEDDMVRFHHGLGTSLRNEWGLWSGDSDLARWMRAKGLRHPDDMSSLILTCLWRRMHDRPLRVDAEVRGYQAYWACTRAEGGDDCMEAAERARSR